MKKIVIILLAVLPIFLIVVISFAGRVFSEVSHVTIESVHFVDDLENKMSNTIIPMNKGDQYKLNVKILPDLASDKGVTYKSSNEDICTVSPDGLVYAVGNELGIAFITVTTNERQLTDRIGINVTNTNVESVDIIDKHGSQIDSVVMSAQDTIDLECIVNPWSALDKSVIWESSDTSIVSVDGLGTIFAKKAGTAIITVRTKDGNKTDTCLVTVNEEKPKLAFDFTSNPNIKPIGTSGFGYSTSLREINIKDYLIYDPSIVNIENVVISVTSGNATYDASTGMLIISGDFVSVVAELNDGSGLKTSINIMIE